MKKFEDVMKVSSEIENISVDDAKKKLNDPNVQFIDVRDKESFEKGTIGNAMHLDRGLLEFYLAEGSPLENDFFKNNPDKEYVLFCGAGGQSTLSTKTMKDMGVKNVKNMSGGYKEWLEKK
jgi:rhodanese-related sulfurtransferase